MYLIIRINIVWRCLAIRVALRAGSIEDFASLIHHAPINKAPATRCLCQSWRTRGLHKRTHVADGSFCILEVGAIGTALVKVEGGKFVLIGNPDAPFYEYDTSSMDWSEPTESNCRAS